MEHIIQTAYLPVVGSVLQCECASLRWNRSFGPNIVGRNDTDSAKDLNFLLQNKKIRVYTPRMITTRRVGYRSTVTIGLRAQVGNRSIWTLEQVLTLTHIVSSGHLYDFACLGSKWKLYVY